MLLEKEPIVPKDLEIKVLAESDLQDAIFLLIVPFFEELEVELEE